MRFGQGLCILVLWLDFQGWSLAGLAGLDGEPRSHQQHPGARTLFSDLQVFNVQVFNVNVIVRL